MLLPLLCSALARVRRESAARRDQPNRPAAALGACGTEAGIEVRRSTAVGAKQTSCVNP